MTATTPIYGLSYPEGSDLVSTAPDSFRAMADTFEQALDQVDRRNTPAGVKPVIATTLNTLATLTGVTGQTGYVTADVTANNGAYVWTGSAWVKFAVASDVSAMRQWVKFGFRMQNDASFAGLAYGGENRLLYNAALRLIRADCLRTLSSSAAFCPSNPAGRAPCSRRRWKLPIPVSFMNHPPASSKPCRRWRRWTRTFPSA